MQPLALAQLKEFPHFFCCTGLAIDHSFYLLASFAVDLLMTSFVDQLFKKPAPQVLGVVSLLSCSLVLAQSANVPQVIATR